MLRSLLERLSRGRVFRRRLPAAFGGHALFVSPDASLKFWRGGLADADPNLLALAAESVQSGAVVWDVGANIGLFAFAAAFRAGPTGRVLAVEADDWLASLLRRSQRSAPKSYAPLSVLNAAISERTGIVEFCIAQRGRAGNHLSGVSASSQTGGVRATAQVAALTLDSLLDTFPRPDLVKIDVEGAEHLCLRGAARLLRQVRPVLIVEVASNNAKEAGDILVEHDYSLLDSTTPQAERSPLVSPVWNTLAVPRAKH